MSAGNGPDFSHKTRGRGRAALTGIMWSAASNLVPTLVSALVFILTSRMLSPTDFGIVAYAAALVTAIAVVSPSGFGEAIVQRSEIDASHADTIFWLCFGWGIGLYLVILAAAQVLAGFHPEAMLGLLMPVLGLRVILDLAAIVPRMLLSRRMAFRNIALRTLFASIIAAVVCLGVLFAGGGLWALVASQLVVSVVGCAVAWLSVDWRPSWRFSRAAIADLKGMGAYSSAIQMVSAINIEQILVGSLMGPAALGLLSFARRIFTMTSNVVTGTLNPISYPLFASMQHERDKLQKTYLAVTFFTSLLAVPTFTGLMLVADQVVPMIFGMQWTGAVTAVVAFASLGLLACLTNAQSVLIRSQGRADYWLKYQLAQQAMTAVAVLLAFRYGVSAVAIAIAAKTWAVWPVTIGFTARLIGLPALTYLRQFALPVAAALTMLVTVPGVGEIMGPGGLTLLVQIVVGLAVYALVIALIARRRLAEVRGLLRRRG